MGVILTNQKKMRNNCIMYSLFGKGGEGRELLWDMESDLSSFCVSYTSVLIKCSQLFSVLQCLR